MRAVDYFDKGAETNLDRTAIIAADASWSYREMRAATESIASALWAGGLRNQEPAGIYSHNDARVLFCMLGIMRAGAVWVPINYRNATDVAVLSQPVSRQRPRNQATCTFAAGRDLPRLRR